jgi:hypothetical protein
MATGPRIPNQQDVPLTTPMQNTQERERQQFSKVLNDGVTVLLLLTGRKETIEGLESYRQHLQQYIQREQMMIVEIESIIDNLKQSIAADS